jgi:hypothetical protein
MFRSWTSLPCSTLIDSGRRSTMAAGLSFDLEDPPAEPPTDCVDHFMWRLAREQFTPHARVDPDGCPECRSDKTCPGRLLAQRGLLTATGRDVLDGDYWRNFARLRERDRQLEVGRSPTNTAEPSSGAGVFGQRHVAHDKARKPPELADASDQDVKFWGLSRVISWNDSTRTLRIISARLRGQDGPVS